jgi:hypothetical protein
LITQLLIGIAAFPGLRTVAICGRGTNV